MPVVRRENHKVAGSKLHLRMVGERHTVQRRHRFTLRTGCNYRNFLRGVTVDISYIYKRACRNVHISETNRRADNIEHTSAGYRYLASVFYAGIYNLLYSVYI